MNLDHGSLVRAFAGQADVVTAIIDGFDELTGPTRLSGWTVRILVGHVTSAVEALWRWQAPAPAEGAITLDAVDYWTAVATAADVNDQWATAYAATRTDEGLRSGLVAALERGATVVAETEPWSTVVLPASTISIAFDQFVATRLVELVVHGLDLVAAGGAEVAPDPGALGIVAAILEARLTGDRPADLADDVAWVEAACGRTDHADERLPVLA
ncbi:MAG: maleylpyruvate isomerase N-terminal domain-containing protein [Acidimicrobiia bacterium]